MFVVLGLAGFGPVLRRWRGGRSRSIRWSEHHDRRVRAEIFDHHRAVVVFVGLDLVDDFVEGAGGEQHFIWTHADPLVGLFVVQQCDFIAEALLE